MAYKIDINGEFIKCCSHSYVINKVNQVLTQNIEQNIQKMSLKETTCNTLKESISCYMCDDLESFIDQLIFTEKKSNKCFLYFIMHDYSFHLRLTSITSLSCMTDWYCLLYPNNKKRQVTNCTQKMAM